MKLLEQLGKRLTKLVATATPIGGTLAAVRTFLAGGKVLFVLGFVALFLFLIVGSRCKPEPPPNVDIYDTPATTPAENTNKILDTTDNTILENRKAEVKSDDTLEKKQETLNRDVKKIKEDTTKTTDQKVKEIGEKQIDSLHSLYQEYYS